MTISTELKQAIEQSIAGTDLFIVDFVFRGDKSYRVIEVYIDSEKGITSGECSQVGVQIQTNLEQLNIPWQYRLEVSSPGLDKPLKDIRQYKRHIGRKAKVTYMENEIEKTVIGEIYSIEEKSVTLNCKDLKIELPFSSLVTTYIQTIF